MEAVPKGIKPLLLEETWRWYGPKDPVTLEDQVCAFEIIFAVNHFESVYSVLCKVFCHEPHCCDLLCSREHFV